MTKFGNESVKMEYYSNHLNDVIDILENESDILVADLKEQFKRALILKRRAIGIFKVKYEIQLTIKMREYIKNFYCDLLGLLPETGLLIMEEPNVMKLTNDIIQRSLNG